MAKSRKQAGPSGTSRKRVRRKRCRAVVRAAILAAAVLAFGAPNVPAWQPRHTKNRLMAKVEALRQKIAAAYDIRTPGAEPFQLVAHYRARNKKGKVISGVMKYYWKSPDIWREEVESDGSRVITVRHGNEAGRTVTGHRTPAGVFIESALLDGLAVPPRKDWPKAKKITIENRMVASEKLTAVSVETRVPLGKVAVRLRARADASNAKDPGLRKDGKAPSPEWVIDGAGLLVDSSSLRLIGWAGGLGDWQIYDNKRWHGKWVPTRIRGFHGDAQVSLWTLTSLTKLSAGSDGMFQIPQESVKWKAQGPGFGIAPFVHSVMPKGVKVKLAHRVLPEYPSRAPAEGLAGRVAMGVSINADGRIGDAWVLKSTGDAFTASALNAVMQWRYKLVGVKPEQCPILWLITVKYAFH